MILGKAVIIIIVTLSLIFRDLTSYERNWLLVLDDGDNFINNPHVLGLTTKNVEWAFNDGALLGVYEPFGWLFKMTVLEFSNRTYNQYIMSVASLSLFLFAAVLSFLYSQRLIAIFTFQNKNLKSQQKNVESTFKFSCMMGVLISFSHPQRAEAVGWLSAQGYPLASVMLLLSAHCHLSSILDHGNKLGQINKTYKESEIVSFLKSEVSVFKCTAVLFFGFACLSKGVATSFCACFAVLEYVYYTWTEGKMKPQTKWGSPNITGWVMVVLRILARQMTCLIFSIFVAQRTLKATAQQTTCGFANDYRKLSIWERILSAFATPLHHLMTFIHPLEPAIEVYYPKESLWKSSYYVYVALVGAVLLLASIFKMVHSGFTKKISRVDFAAALYISYVSVLAPTLGIIGSSGDHLCYVTADRYGFIAFTTVVPVSLGALVFSTLSRTSESKNKSLCLSLSVLVVLLGCSTWVPLQSFRSDSSHYRRVVGHRKDRAFPHYLLGLSLQRDADRLEREAEQYHREALTALYASEELATGWLNLAAARADSHLFLRDYRSAAQDLYSICRNKPGVSGGAYDYKLATTLEKLREENQNEFGCERAAHHFNIAVPQLLAHGNKKSATYASQRAKTCWDSKR